MSDIEDLDASHNQSKIIAALNAALPLATPRKITSREVFGSAIQRGQRPDTETLNYTSLINT